MMNRKKIQVLLGMMVLSAAVVFTGCGTNTDSAKPAATKTEATKAATSGKVTVVGSTSVQPLAQLLGDNYSKTSGVKVDIQGVGSTAGIKAIHEGTCDIGTSSRELTKEEKAWGLKETVIAMDGIAVIVNPKNKVADLTKDQVVKIFKGEIKNWKEVGGIDKEIIVVSREAGSGTRGAFEELLKLQKKEGDKTISLVIDNALIAEGNGSVMANIAGKENAIGYMSMGMVDAKKVSKVKIDGVEATEDNVKADKYAIKRPFLMLTSATPSKDTQAFIDYILGKDGQAIVAKEYIAVK